MNLSRMLSLALVIGASVVVPAVAVATPASAATGKAKSKGKATAKPKLRHLDASFATQVYAPPGQTMPTTGSMTMWVPKGVKAAGDTMPSCAPELISARGVRACPTRSLVGKGTAAGLIAFISQTAREQFVVTLLNGPGNTLIAHVRGTNPVSVDVAMQSVITRPAGKYGMQMYFPFPDELIHPVPGSTASMEHVSARLDGKIGWLRSTSCPTRGWSLGAMLTNVDGSFLKITADLECV